MTCVAAIVEDGKVYMAADSAGVDGYSLQVRRDPKIFRVGEMLIGFTSSFRMGQLLGYSLDPPKHHQDVPVERYMATSFIDAVRDTLKRGGFAKKDGDVESGGQFLVGYRGRIFCVEGDYQVGEVLEPFAAVGCGADLARGALYVTRSVKVLDPERCLKLALEAAERFSAGVRRPFIFEQL